MDLYRMFSYLVYMQRLKVNMVRTKILISAHHGHTFNSGANTNFFFFLFILTVWLLLV